jgi:hypothetical protein
MASNSEKQRALYRSREAAKAAGTLPAWYAAREAAKPPTLEPTRESTYTPLPDHCDWDERGYLIWKLPLHTGPQWSSGPRN